MAAIDSIIGGIDVPAGDTLIIGGAERIFGEETRWGIRDKFIRYKHAIANDAPDAEYLRILGIKPRVTFDKHVYYDDTKGAPTPAPGGPAAAIAARLNVEIDDLIAIYIRKYDLPKPMRMALCDMIKRLAPAAAAADGPLAAAAADGPLAAAIQSRCDINLPVRPGGAANMFELIIDMIPRTAAAPLPTLIPVKKPCICAARLPAIASQIDDIKKEKLTTAAEYAFAVLRVEEILSPHLLLHEKYYIAHAKNIGIIAALVS